MEKLQISSVFVTLAVVFVCSRHGHVAAQDVASIVTKEIFDEIVAPASDCEGSGFYTYNEFIGAANAFEGFGTSSSDNVNRREIAAFFANTAHETGQFCYINEINQSNDYCDTTNTQYPCVEGKKYFGRGPIQLSWNFNYGPAGEYLNFDGLSNPEVVATDPAISYKTAVWYWMVQSECHTAITSGEGFGATINAINGAIECNGGNTDAVNSRVNYFRQYCDLFGVDPGSNLTC